MVAGLRTTTKAEVEVAALFLRTAKVEVELEVDLLLLQLLSNLTLLVQLSESSAKVELAAKGLSEVNATAELAVEPPRRSWSWRWTYRHLSHLCHICRLAGDSSTVSVHSKFLAKTCHRTPC